MWPLIVFEALHPSCCSGYFEASLNSFPQVPAHCSAHTFLAGQQSSWPWGVHILKTKPLIHQEERKRNATLTFLPQPESVFWLDINHAEKHSHSLA